MDTKRAIELAENYLTKRHILYTSPVRVVEMQGAAWEVIFTVPGALDPNVVVDPPDVRVLVETDTSRVELVQDM